MRYAIVSDIHSNLEAFSEVVQTCQREKVDGFYCLGDIVGYGANPNECLKLISEIQAVCIAGNHDWAAGGKLDPRSFSDDAKAAVLWTRKQLASSEREFLNALELNFKNEHMTLVHGTLNHPEEFNYLYDIEQARETFYLMDRTVCFIGHTHVPQILLKKGELISWLQGQEISLNPPCKYIINVGSVG